MPWGTGRLTVFAKSRMREEWELGRARRALVRCVADEHTAEEDSDAEA